MRYIKRELKKGINLHLIKANGFKTNLIAVFISTPLTRENVTYNSLITSVLRRGSKNMPSQEEISKKMEEMYGASFDCGIDKTGDNHVLKFYIESINDKFIPNNNEKMLEESINNALEIVFNPIIENGSFKQEYVDQEKETIKRKIESRVDNKARYAIDRCLEEMYKNKPYGLYRFGFIEDLVNIDSKKLYDYYINLINTCKIDIFISGEIEDQQEGYIKDLILNNENVLKLKERDALYVKSEISPKENVTEKIVNESSNVVQGKLVLGLDVKIENIEELYHTSVYNSILGGSATSKLFQEVREKASLAYTASSSFIKHKENIIINCGIEIENFEKALNIIRKQLEDIKTGKFTNEELENSKNGIISAIKGMTDEQDTEITYYFGQELSGTLVSPDEYIEKINQVSKEDVIRMANKININTIYFLKN